MGVALDRLREAYRVIWQPPHGGFADSDSHELAAIQIARKAIESAIDACTYYANPEVQARIEKLRLEDVQAAEKERGNPAYYDSPET